jgi:hypothetical protein
MAKALYEAHAWKLGDFSESNLSKVQGSELFLGLLISSTQEVNSNGTCNLRIEEGATYDYK